MVQLRYNAEEFFKQGQRMTLMVEGSDLAEITKEDINKDHFVAIA